MGSAYHVWKKFKGDIGWGIYVRYLCVVFVRGMCTCGFGQVWVGFRGFGGERAVREPEKTGDTGGVRVCGTRAVTGSERGVSGRMAVLGACQWYERGIQEGERAENGGLRVVEGIWEEHKEKRLAHRTFQGDGQTRSSHPQSPLSEGVISDILGIRK